MDDIKLYKLPNSQEIIGRVVEAGFGWVVLEKVLTFAVVPKGPDQYELSPRPYSPTLPEAKWKFLTNQFLAEPVDTPDSLKKWYIQNTSQIEIVSSMDQVK